MITTIQFKTLDDLYQFYNDAIFNGELSECIVKYVPSRWGVRLFRRQPLERELAGKKVVHEISINPDFMNREDRDWHSTLVHEMCHLWQEDFGRPSRGGYHNSQWADKMIQVGLMPSDTGEAGGKRTGQSITHYIIPGGKFEQVFNTLSREDLQNLRLRYKPTLAAVPTRPIRIAGSDGDERKNRKIRTEGRAKAESGRNTPVGAAVTCGENPGWC